MSGDDDFCTPRVPKDTPTEQKPAVLQQPKRLLPPRSESEQRQDDADEVPTH